MGVTYHLTNLDSLQPMIFDTNDTFSDNGQQAVRKAHLSFKLWWAYNISLSLKR